MPQSGFTPIINYNTSTASAVPLATNLNQGELAINVTDKKIYTKNSGGAVVQIGSGPDTTETLTNKTITTPLGLTKTDVGLGSVDNTADASKPVSTLQQSALDLKINTSAISASGGVAALSGFKLAIKNATGLITSTLGTTAGVVRDWILPNKSGTVALREDLTDGSIAANFGAIVSTTGITFGANLSRIEVTDGNTVLGNYNDGHTIILSTRSVTTGNAARVTVDSEGQVSIDGSLSLAGAARRITGDFSNATLASRVMFQTSLADSSTLVRAIPSGTGTTAALQVGNTSDPANQSVLALSVNSTGANVESFIDGTGTQLPMLFWTSGSERLRIATTGAVTIPGTLSTESASAAQITAKGYSAHGGASVSNGQVLVGGSAAYQGTIQYDAITGALGNLYIDNTQANTGAGITMRVQTSGTPINALSISGSGAVTIPGSLTTGITKITNSTNSVLQVRGGSAFVGGDGGTIHFSTFTGSGVTSTSQYAAAIASSNSYGSETNGESGHLVFYTNYRTGTNTYTGLTEKMRITDTGVVTIPGSLSLTGGTLGYGVGAGGTVNQATSKSTGVTLNKPTGRITTANESVAAGGYAAFQFVNSTLGAYDRLLISVSDAYGYKYNVWGYAYAPGSCWVLLKNITAGALAETLILDFSIVKGSVS